MTQRLIKAVPQTRESHLAHRTLITGTFVRRITALRRAVCGVVFFGLVTPSARADTEVVPKAVEVRLGVIAQQANEPDRMFRVYSDLLEELRTRLKPKNIGVAPLVIALDVPDLARKVKQADVDLVVETAFATFELQDESAGTIAPRFAIVRRNQREYHTVFFTRKDSLIQRLEDLRGRTIVLQADRSTSAFAVPRMELARKGIKLVLAGQPNTSKSSVAYLFAGAELNQAVWVLNKKGDAGAFNEGDWSNLPEKMRAGLRIFHETRPLLRGLLSFRVGLDPRTKALCEEALLELDKDPVGRAALAKAAGITRLDPLTTKDLASLAEWRMAFRGAAR